jgi:uncharacterized protein (TIGR02266 family)
MFVAVDVTSGHNFFTGRTRDISLGGLFIETGAGLQIGSRVHLELSVLDEDFSVRAEVMWTLLSPDGRAEGSGVRFIGLPLSGRKAIEQFMKLREPMAFEMDEPDASEEPALAGRRKGPPPLPRS